MRTCTRACPVGRLDLTIHSARTRGRCVRAQARLPLELWAVMATYMGSSEVLANETSDAAAAPSRVTTEQHQERHEEGPAAPILCSTVRTALVMNTASLF